MRFLYPLTLDVSNRLIVIIGGGAVAARKAAGLLEAGATRIRVVAPQFHDTLSEKVERISETYRPAHLDGAHLVFATTSSPQVNQQVQQDAHARGLLVNRTDDSEAGGDFVTPARFCEGELLVAVTAGSPMLAVAIRNDLARKTDKTLVKMAHAMQSLRPVIRDSGLDGNRRQAIFRDLAGEEAISALDTGGIEQLRQWLSARYPELKL